MRNDTEIEENRKDAGCNSKEIREILDCYQKGDRKRMETLIAVCRKDRLNRLHECQQCIDRLDFLTFQMDKQRLRGE